MKPQDKQPSPAAVQAAVQAARKAKMKQAIRDTSDPEMIELDREFCHVKAKIEMRWLQAYIGVGFTREEAMDMIVASMGGK